MWVCNNKDIFVIHLLFFLRDHVCKNVLMLYDNKLHWALLFHRPLPNGVRGIKKLKLKVVFLIKFEIKFIPLYGSYMQGQDYAHSALP